MDNTATLKADEAAAWSDAELPLHEAHRRNSTVTPNGVEDYDALEAFDEGLRLKSILDSLEDRLVNEPLWELLSIVLNCEYRIYVVYESIPLRQCPFLSHWVETAQKLRGQLRNHEDEPDQTKRGPTTKGALIARLELITRILYASDRQEFDALELTPQSLCDIAVSPNLDLRPYIRMLEEEGIYDGDVSTSERQAEQDHAETPFRMPNGNSSSSGPPKPDDRAPWQTEIRALLFTDQQQAIHRLKHLPIEITTLDFLTTLIADNTLTSLSIDPSPIIRDYLQRSLRIVELMTEPPPADDGMYSDNNNSNEDGHSSEVPDDYGRPAQERAVKLLLLFMRNLIVKGLVPVNEMFFEIQEVVVRYIFMREVREFKGFVEGEGSGMGDGGGER